MKSRMLSYTAIRIHAQTRLLMSRSVHFWSRNWQIFQMMNCWNPWCSTSGFSMPSTQRLLQNSRSATEHSAVSAQGAPHMKQSKVWISFMKPSLPYHRKWRSWWGSTAAWNGWTAWWLLPISSGWGVWNCSTPAWQTSQKKWQKPVRSLNICGITQKRMTGTVSYTTTTVRKLPQR